MRHDQAKKFLKDILKEASDSASKPQQQYKQFGNTLTFLEPLERATAWLAYRAEHRESDDDLECLVFLASRGHNIDRHVTQVRAEWRLAEQDCFEQFQSVTNENDSSQASPLNPWLPEWHREKEDGTMHRIRLAGGRRAGLLPAFEIITANAQRSVQGSDGPLGCPVLDDRIEIPHFTLGPRM